MTKLYTVKIHRWAFGPMLYVSMAMRSKAARELAAAWSRAGYSTVIAGV